MPVGEELASPFPELEIALQTLLKIGGEAVGRVELWYIDGSQAMENGFDIVDICDSLGQEKYDYASAVYSSVGSELADSRTVRLENPRCRSTIPKLGIYHLPFGDTVRNEIDGVAEPRSSYDFRNDRWDSTGESCPASAAGAGTHCARTTGCGRRRAASPGNARGAAPPPFAATFVYLR